ncbi:MAG: 5'-nucleotidase C-terminal domain-containing protein [Propionibacteriaceae bacterium]|jgi:LPXTG-motif cell wall-anchored protein|nr:5'-nucleotidase C-terminal domain-containing protein [Propionibacteriaceae bacterium]
MLSTPRHRIGGLLSAVALLTASFSLTGIVPALADTGDGAITEPAITSITAPEAVTEPVTTQAAAPQTTDAVAPEAPAEVGAAQPAESPVEEPAVSQDPPAAPVEEAPAQATEAVADRAATADSVRIISFNDFHGRISTDITVPWAATLEQAALESPESTLVVSGGDNIGASLFDSFVQQDQPTIDVLNDFVAAGIGFEASTVGNHEFDGGFADLRDRVIPAADWTYLGANVIDTATGEAALPAYHVQTLGNGIRVGIIGVVSQETPALVSPAGVVGLDFTDPVAAVNTWADYLTDNNLADVIVADYHEGASDPTSLEAAEAASEVFTRIANETNANVDAIITAHTHQLYAWQANGRPIVQAASYGSAIGVIDLVIDPATMTVTSGTAQTITSMAAPEVGSAEEAAMLAIGNVQTIADHVAAAVETGQALGQQTVGKISDDITTSFKGGEWVSNGMSGSDHYYIYENTGSATRDDRANESTLGTLVADAFLNAADSDSSDAIIADIGIVNAGGGLRAELLYADSDGDGPDFDGNVTYAEANAVLPFANNLWTVTVTGAQLKTFLEQQWQTTETGERPSRAFLATGLSSNVSYIVDTDQPEADPCTMEEGCGWSDPASHVRAIFVDGQPVEADKEYRIITVSFLASGGDNYRVMAEGTDARDTGLLDRDAWIDYLMQESLVSEPGDWAEAPVSPNYSHSSVVVSNLYPETAPMEFIEVSGSEELSATLSRTLLASLGTPNISAGFFSNSVFFVPLAESGNQFDPLTRAKDLALADAFWTPDSAAAEIGISGTIGSMGSIEWTAPGMDDWTEDSCADMGVPADLNPASIGCASLRTTPESSGGSIPSGDYVLTIIHGASYSGHGVVTRLPVRVVEEQVPLSIAADLTGDAADDLGLTEITVPYTWEKTYFAPGTPQQKFVREPVTGEITVPLDGSPVTLPFPLFADVTFAWPTITVDDSGITVYGDYSTVTLEELVALTGADVSPVLRDETVPTSAIDPSSYLAEGLFIDALTETMTGRVVLLSLNATRAATDTTLGTIIAGPGAQIPVTPDLPVVPAPSDTATTLPQTGSTPFITVALIIGMLAVIGGGVLVARRRSSRSPQEATHTS